MYILFTTPADRNPTTPINDLESTQPAKSSAPETPAEPVKVKVKAKTIAELDEELKLKLEGISGEGGAAGLEYENGKARLLSPNRNFLEVLEIPLSPGQPREPARTLLDITDVDNLDDELKTLPPQDNHTIRVYFSENLNVHEDEASITTPSSAGIPAMISQWSLSSKKIRWETNSYSLLLPITSREIPAMDSGETYIDSVSIAAGTIRRTLRCIMFWTEDGNITLYIDAISMIQDMDLLFDQLHLKTHDTRVPSPREAFDRHRNFCGNLRNSIEAYSFIGAQVTPVSGSGLKQVLFLCYSHALVQEYTDSMYRLQANYARKKEGLSDPRGATLKIFMLAEITRDLCFYEEVKDRTREVFGAVDALVDSLKILLVDSTNYRDFLCLAVELQSTCTDLKRTIAALSKTLDDHLRLFELSRGLHEAQNVRLLSILASIFLPLSLALTISSFLVGMVKDVQLGLTILGFGCITAATIGVFIMLFGELYIGVLSPWAAAISLLMFNWNS
ncbi:hypothetical protein V497_04801 [Pseudogymnoascus sp. VKM F-4516 (FW-969)]|nr:hypothetical protein V497_04801 [Pseudogymnoascus sp. VKM F-4516 (FW-969)]